MARRRFGNRARETAELAAAVRRRARWAVSVSGGLLFINGIFGRATCGVYSLAARYYLRPRFKADIALYTTREYLELLRGKPVHLRIVNSA